MDSPWWVHHPRTLKNSQTFTSPLTGGGKGGGGHSLIPPTLILPSKGGGDFLCCLLMNSKGISVLFLIIALLLMVTIGYVLSYLIPTKQKSVRFPIYSNQAFYIAQSGVEYAIRYSAEQGWRGTSDGSPSRYDIDRLNDSGNNQRTLVIGKLNGRFTINYTTATDLLTSTGEIINSSEDRVIKVSRFTDFLRLIFDLASAAPCWTVSLQTARFYFKNVRADTVTLTAFSASWTRTGKKRDITRIDMNGVQKYSGTYGSGDGRVNFNMGGNSQTIISGQVITVLIYWDSAMKSCQNLIITFYTSTGDGSTLGYTFNLDSAGDGLPNC